MVLGGCRSFLLLVTTAKCVPAILELNQFEWFGDSKNLKFCRQLLLSSTQMQNRSFHVVDRTATAKKCTKFTLKACKTTLLHF